jgi:malate dehydrogenase
VDEGLIFSFPITSDGQGGYSIVQNLPMSDWAKGQFANTLQELREERAVVVDLLK